MPEARQVKLLPKGASENIGAAWIDGFIARAECNDDVVPPDEAPLPLRHEGFAVFISTPPGKPPEVEIGIDPRLLPFLCSSPDAAHQLMQTMADAALESVLHSPGQAQSWFSNLGSLAIETPRVRQLLLYQDQIARDLRLLESDKARPNIHAAELLSKIPSDRQASVAHKIIERIKDETSLFETTDELGLYQRLTELVDGRKLCGRVRFVDPDSKKGREMSRSGSSGRFNNIYDTIEILGAPPSPPEIVISLADTGTLPTKLDTLRHELTHRAQRDQMRTIGYLSVGLAPIPIALGIEQIIKGIAGSAAGSFAYLATIIGMWSAMPQIKNALRPDPLLKELHAREESKSSPDTASPQRIFQARLESAAEVVLSGGYAVDPTRFGLALKAYQDIRALRLLGLSGLEIARVVRDSRYDKRSDSYPKLHSKVTDAAREWGVKDEQGLDALLHALLAKDQMDLRVQQALARKIAIETLLVESGELASPVGSEVRPH